MWRDEAYLLDMLLAASDAISFASGLDAESFQASDLHQSAILRKLEIIGEAAGQVSKDFQSRHPDIPWSGMISLRNRLIHGYRVVQIEIIWQVVQRDLPVLIEALTPLIPPENELTS